MMTWGNGYDWKNKPRVAAATSSSTGTMPSSASGSAIRPPAAKARAASKKHRRTSQVTRLMPTAGVGHRGPNQGRSAVVHRGRMGRKYADAGLHRSRSTVENITYRCHRATNSSFVSASASVCISARMCSPAPKSRPALTRQHSRLVARSSTTIHSGAPRCEPNPSNNMSGSSRNRTPMASIRPRSLRPTCKRSRKASRAGVVTRRG